MTDAAPWFASRSKGFKEGTAMKDFTAEKQASNRFADESAYNKRRDDLIRSWIFPPPPQRNTGTNPPKSSTGTNPAPRTTQSPQTSKGGNMLAYFLIHDENEFENAIVSEIFEFPFSPHKGMSIEIKLGNTVIVFEVEHFTYLLSEGFGRMHVSCSTENLEIIRTARPRWPKLANWLHK